MRTEAVKTESVEETHAGRKESGQSMVSQKTADFIAGLSSPVAGGLTFWRITEERVYKNLSSQGIWEDLKPARREKGMDILRQAESGAINSETAYASLKEAVMQGEKLADGRLKRLGSDNLLKQFGLLRNHQKWEVVVSTLAVGGIALGSILLLTREMTSGKEQDGENVGS